RVFKTDCVDGIYNITTVYFTKGLAGRCQQMSYCKEESCLKPEEQCKCRVFGQPNYITFDNNMLLFSGSCSYILAQHSDPVDPSCNFIVVGVNKESQYGSKHLEQIDIRLGQNPTVLLGKDRQVTVENTAKSVPIKLADGSVIFNVGRYVRFESQKCGLRVAFDGVSSLTISAPKSKYSGKLSGICGNCNGVKDDFVTRDGKQIPPSEDRAELLAKSWVSDRHTCSSEKDFTHVANFCKDDLSYRSKVEANVEYCGLFLNTTHGPFKSCLDQLDSSLLHKTCVREFCMVPATSKVSDKARCESLKSLEEMCIEKKHEIDSIWRDAYKCPISCGSNMVHTKKVPSCPETCESHLFGASAPCHTDLEVPGCKCRSGFVLDGNKCVAPEKCRCLDRCEDQVNAEKCKKWVTDGRCTEFPEMMKNSCAFSCGFCNKTRRSKSFFEIVFLLQIKINAWTEQVWINASISATRASAKRNSTTTCVALPATLTRVVS
ncbi:hypothetical protein Ciccas_006835, partial [Cichlidogyrus casuarinus]